MGIIIKGVVKATSFGHEQMPGFVGVGGMFGVFAALEGAKHQRYVHAAGNVDVLHLDSAAVQAIAEANAYAKIELYRVCTLNFIDILSMQAPVHEPGSESPEGLVRECAEHHRHLELIRQHIGNTQVRGWTKAFLEVGRHPPSWRSVCAGGGGGRLLRH